jgi:hypothetical protein
MGNYIENKDTFNATPSNIVEGVTTLVGGLNSINQVLVDNDNYLNETKMDADNITDSVSTTSSTISASATAVKTAYDLANTKQDALGYTPVQQGTGTGQRGNIVKIGWTGLELNLEVDTINMGKIYTEYNKPTPAEIGAQPSGTYNTVIGTDTDINTIGSTIIDNIFVTDGVITSMGTRTLTATDIGATDVGYADGGALLGKTSLVSDTHYLAGDGYLWKLKNGTTSPYTHDATDTPNSTYLEKITHKETLDKVESLSAIVNDYEILYETSTGLAGGDITLSESIFNYEVIEVLYSDDDKRYFKSDRMRVSDYVKYISSVSTRALGVAGGQYWYFRFSTDGLTLYGYIENCVIWEIRGLNTR